MTEDAVTDGAVTDGAVTDGAVTDGARPAGDFGTWLAAIRGAIAGERDMDVPCDGCTACCTSSQFVHVEPDETETLARIPAALLFPAPGRPPGHVVLGYDEHGHCPMLVDGACTIYAHRPRACRTYDCRVFAAAGVDVDHGKDAIEARVRQWRFAYAGEDDRARRDAIEAAARFVDEHGRELAVNVPSAADHAVLAIAVHEQFVRRDARTGRAAVVVPEVASVLVEIRRGSAGGD